MRDLVVALVVAGCGAPPVAPSPRPRPLDTYGCFGGPLGVRLTIRGELLAVELQDDGRALPVSCVLQPLAEPVR